MKNKFFSMALLCLSFFWVTPASAVQINVDPGAYTGKWIISGATINLTGPQLVDVNPGTYGMYISDLPGHFTIDVSDTGEVTSRNTVAATGVGNTLTFNNTVLNIEPGAYTGGWTLAGVVRTAGSLSVTLVPGLKYVMYIADTPGRFEFGLAANGDVTSLNSAAATGSANTLTFNNTVFNVEPDAYMGGWTIAGVKRTAGPLSVTLVPGLDYVMYIADTPGRFEFGLAANGDVTSQNSAAATGSTNTITFNNTELNVEPDAYTGGWTIAGVKRTAGPLSVTLVPGINYVMYVSDVPGRFGFGLAANGDATSHNAAAATGMGNTLALNNTVINIEPGLSTSRWVINGTTAGEGPQLVTLVPGVGYSFYVGSEKQVFTVAEPCAINPTQFDIGGDTFNVTCGALDSDGDGVPDDTDNCPNIINPDQIDQDIDGIGNLCDTDLDGDGFENNIDNCPAIENPNQGDLDADGTGDVCDTDTDGDAVPDDEDNCPSEPNTDQANSDTDLLGDVCDGDDDNDGVDDSLDNCPLAANANQSDFDGNGQGDICDGDVDGDSVANNTDACPSSSAGQIVNIEGCTGPQFIAKVCVKQNFVQHGQYVSCVAHATNDAVKQGLITQKDKGKYIKKAASKK